MDEGVAELVWVGDSQVAIELYASMQAQLAGFYEILSRTRDGERPIRIESEAVSLSFRFQPSEQSNQRPSSAICSVVALHYGDASPVLFALTGIVSNNELSRGVGDKTETISRMTQKHGWNILSTPSMDRAPRRALWWRC